MSFYAVRIGRTPGIYKTWAECQKQTLRFPGAQFKKFDELKQAERFLVDGTVKTKDGLCYSPYKNCGHTLAEDAIIIKTTAAALKSKALEEEDDFKSKTGTVDGTAKGKVGVRYSPYNKNDHKKDAKKTTGAASKSKVCATTPEEAEDDSEPATVVYTDGCCHMNGMIGASGGIGVYWGEDDPRNLSEKLEGRQTNNRAEIEACCRALEQAKSQGIKKVEIRTDSAFMINAMTTWIDGWKERDWISAANVPVKNADDWKRLDECQRDMKIIWTHVTSHSGEPGNEAADLLAKKGATMTSKEETDS